MGIEGPFWRAIAVFRVASLAYAALLVLRAGGYARPAVAWAVVGVMAVWTVVMLVPRPAARRGPLLAADLVVTAGCLLATPYAQSRGDMLAGAIPITATWVAGPVLAYGVARGRRAGAVAAAVMSAADLWLRSDNGVDLASIPVNGAVLMFMAGVVVGHVARLAREAEERMRRAARIEAAGRERERLARGIHDSVLQVLALVQRRGAEIGGEAAELGRLAGEQEAALRALVQAPPVAEAPDPASPPGLRGRFRSPARPRRPLAGEGTSRGTDLAGTIGPAEPEVDLRDLLRPYGTSRVTVSAPATPLPLPPESAREVAAAVGAALDNVVRHCPEGTRAWILAEEDGGAVVVTVRDDGPGIPEGRLEQAVDEGRMGVARSIRGRVADLGGTVAITSSRTGTEIELSVPVPAWTDEGDKRRS
ncbi:MacS family sensor histidine kinase [Microbispora sp. CA-102843]|uniref:MacS family sensor histidine kinase n=1 Tax=Microbispora sp. CA-102843 TaxID=3239952 RepID=UPI003D8CEC0A